MWQRRWFCWCRRCGEAQTIRLARTRVKQAQVRVLRHTEECTQVSGGPGGFNLLRRCLSAPPFSQFNPLSSDERRNAICTLSTTSSLLLIKPCFST